MVTGEKRKGGNLEDNKASKLMNSVYQKISGSSGGLYPDIRKPGARGEKKMGGFGRKTIADKPYSTQQGKGCPPKKKTAIRYWRKRGGQRKKKGFTKVGGMAVAKKRNVEKVVPAKGRGAEKEKAGRRVGSPRARAERGISKEA